jgi:protein involved in polysaccharide export with SLBB domain
MPAARTGGTTAVTVRVPLDSSYLCDRKPGIPYNGVPGIGSAVASAPEVPLEAYDNVLILRQPDFSLPRTVTIKGEVRFPGEYTLRNKNERITDLVNRAGGLTPEAYAGGVVFTRTEGQAGRIGVDLPAVLRDPSSIDNLLLLNGDAIEIPVHSAVVKVTGAVNSPISVPYVSGADLEYYVYAAGGPTEKGNAGKAFVTQPNGKVEARRGRLFLASTPKPQPGSTITVPEVTEVRRFDPAAVLATTTSILTSLLAAVAILKR